MNRRSFLKGLFATGVVSAVAPAINPLELLRKPEVVTNNVPKWVGTASSFELKALTYEDLVKMFEEISNAPFRPNIMIVSKRVHRQLVSLFGVEFDLDEIEFKPLTYKEV